MYRIAFVCHGNICRSPMAEFVLKDLVAKRGLKDMYEIASFATSTEELGNPVHRGTKTILSSLGIDCSKKRAVQLTAADYAHYDAFYLMDSNNMRNIRRIFKDDPENKVHMLLDRDVADPWYTGDFNKTYEDVLYGCEKIIKQNGL